jgi:hypothetical protein
MKRKLFVLGTGSVLALLVATVVAVAQTKSADKKASTSPTQRVLDQSAEDGKFTFLVFYKTDNAAAREMLKTAKDGAAKRGDKAVVAFVNVADPAEKVLVEKFDVARSPMPLTLALAPNLAVTGIFAKDLTDEHIEAAIVTPTMTRCMKALQEQKLVFVCLQTGPKVATPAVVQSMQLDPEFSPRVVIVPMQLNDPEETRFLQQMQVDPKQVKAPLAALLAPPGVLIGKYDGAAKKDEVIGALHQAGKCCDDPNCKHNHNHGTSTERPANSRRK